MNVDATVLAQAPKLAPHLPEMAKRLADVLGIPVDRVSVKAKSPEGLGPAWAAARAWPPWPSSAWKTP